MVKRLLTAVICGIFFFLISLGGTSTMNVTNAASTTNPLKTVQDFKIYYGSPTTSIINKLSSYDMVVIEPHAYTIEQIKKIETQGTKTIGYISVIELSSWVNDFVAKTKEEDYYHQSNGKRVPIPAWNTYLMDISNPHYRQLLLSEIKAQIVQKQFDGVFLDTVDDLDHYWNTTPAERTKMREGYEALLKDIKKLYPNLVLVQNRGFETLQTNSLPYIDGFLWEDFNKTKLVNNDWGQKWIGILQNYSNNNNLAVFSVVPTFSSKGYSVTNQFIPSYNKNDNYNSW
ncbi:putative glycoside hydrolase [Bacillus sp. V5-8f]|uniref:putative glycoside hydrolase n=1 Tax=Bacillus sp. V5-8f TaxID=2053044 RepID=UPI000C77BDCB|nr:endo alpha-1,4 polygalactosaminidase [Bacillus sp. V5-8f]PLT32609.1 glucanotransferase [Bacillus sp. V5-8f]